MNYCAVVIFLVVLIFILATLLAAIRKHINWIIPAIDCSCWGGDVQKKVTMSFKAGDLLKHTLKNGVEQYYMVEECLHGVAGEIGVIKMKSWERKNTIDGVPYEINVESNMVTAMIEAGILKVLPKQG